MESTGKSSSCTSQHRCKQKQTEGEKVEKSVLVGHGVVTGGHMSMKRDIPSDIPCDLLLPF
jgi:hypothetical protein